MADVAKPLARDHGRAPGEPADSTRRRGVADATGYCIGNTALKLFVRLVNAAGGGAICTRNWLSRTLCEIADRNAASRQ